MDFIFILLALIIGIPVHQKILKITNTPALAAFGVFAVGLTTSLVLSSVHNIQYYSMQNSSKNLDMAYSVEATKGYSIANENIQSGVDTYSFYINDKEVLSDEYSVVVDNENHRIMLVESK